MNFIQEHHARGEVVTGLLYVDPDPADLHQHLNTAATPFNSLGADRLCPGAEVLERVNASLR
jgi:2-oxoglutarate ferredoxin oxidoreductase subunit beta